MYQSEYILIFIKTGFTCKWLTDDLTLFGFSIIIPCNDDCVVSQDKTIHEWYSKYNRFMDNT